MARLSTQLAYFFRALMQEPDNIEGLVRDYTQEGAPQNTMKAIIEAFDPTDVSGSIQRLLDCGEEEAARALAAEASR